MDGVELPSFHPNRKYARRDGRTADPFAALESKQPDHQRLQGNGALIMPRLNVVDPATATGKAKEIFDGPLAQKKLNIFRGIANNPGVLDAFLRFSSGVKAGSLTPAEHELVALATAQSNACEYCLAVHTKIGAGQGIDAKAAVEARQGKATDARQQALLRFTSALIEKRGSVSDADLKAFRTAGFDDAAVVETVGAVVVNFFTNFFNQVNQTTVDTMFDAAPKI